MQKHKPRTIALNRRTILAAAGAATAALAAPRILRAQGKELVVGGAASHKTFVETVIAPVVEKKYGCKVVFEGTRSLVNLEKMQKNKDKQYLSVVMMDDPVTNLSSNSTKPNSLLAQSVRSAASRERCMPRMAAAARNSMR